MTRASSGEHIDVSDIPGDELDDVVDEVGGLVVFHRKLRLSAAVVRGLSAEEKEAAGKLLELVRQSLVDGKSTLTRAPSGHVVSGEGIDSPPRPPGVPIARAGEYELKLKSLRKGGITFGKRLRMNHAVVQALARGGSVAALVLAWMPVAAWIVAVVGASTAALEAFDRGAGVYFYVTYGGVWWARAA